MFYAKTSRSDFESEFKNGNLYEFSYDEDDRVSQLEVMKLALNRIQSIVLPMLNDIVDIDSCARFFIKMDYCFNPNVHFDAVKGGNLNPNNVADEGLLIMKIKDYPEFVDRKLEHSKIKKREQVKLPQYKYTQEEYEDYCGRIDEIKKGHLSKMSEIVNDTQFYNKIMLELENRKRSNTERLISYGLYL